MDELRAKQEQLWRSVRTLAPPSGAQARVLQRIEANSQRRPRWGYYWLAAAGMIAAAAALLLWPRIGVIPHAKVVAASGVYHADTPVLPGMALPIENIIVTEGGRLELALAHGQIEIEGPAHFDAPLDQPLSLHRGTMHIRGTATVACQQCLAHARGEVQIETTAARTQVTVFAGSADVEASGDTCTVIYAAEYELAWAEDAAGGTAETEDTLSAAPAEPAPGAILLTDGLASDDGPDSDDGASARAAEDDVAPTRAAPSARGRQVMAQPDPSELAEQVAAYEGAIARGQTDAKAALVALRQFRRTWPHSPLAHEVDLAIFEFLIQLQRPAEIRRAGRAFLRRYPRSAKAPAVRQALAEAAP